MTTLNKVLIGSFLVGTITYGILAFKRQQELLDQSSLTMKGVKLALHSTQNATLSGTLQINNKSIYSFNVLSHSIGIYLNGIYISNVVDSGNLHVNPAGITSIPVSVDFNPLKALGSSVLSTLGNAFAGLNIALGDISFQLKGRLIYQLGIYVGTYPVDLTYKLSDVLNSSIT